MFFLLNVHVTVATDHIEVKKSTGVLLCRLPALAEATYRDHFCRLASSSSSSSQKISVTFFSGNHTGQLFDIWHRASVWRTVSCNAFLNLRHVHFLYFATLNIVDIGKFDKIIPVNFFWEPQRPAS